MSSEKHPSPPPSDASCETPTAVLFVCLGNICRSPLAEGVFQHLVAKRGTSRRYHVDSAGTGAWHAGEPADPRSREVAERNGIFLRGRARQVQEEDFHQFDLILAMDRTNMADLETAYPGSDARAKLRLFRELDPEGEGDLDVPDPYYGGSEGFDQVFAMVLRSCTALLNELEGAGGPRPR